MNDDKIRVYVWRALLFACVCFWAIFGYALYYLCANMLD